MSCGHQQFPPKLADVGDPRGPDEAETQIDLPGVAEPEGLVRQVAVGQRLQQLPRRGPITAIIAIVPDTSVTVTNSSSVTMAPQPARVARRGRRGAEHQELVLVDAG